MKGAKREFDLRPNFLRELAKIEAYVGQSNPRRGRQFVSELFDFISDVIESNPYAFPEDPYRRTPTHEFRRAVFRKQYLIAYRVTDELLQFLTIFHTSRDPGSIRLDE